MIDSIPVDLYIPSFKTTDIDRSPHRGLLSVLGRNGGPTESQVSNLLQALLYSPDRWLKGPITPLRFSSGRPRQAAMDYLTTDRHVWQPDIDLLWGPMFGSVKLSPMHAIELKHFALVRDRDKVIPKTRQKQGFYAGLDETLALTLTGVDSVSLWHVFQLPWHYWRLLEDGDWEQATDGYTEFSGAYGGKLAGLIGALGLPIGYQRAGLLVDRDDDGSPKEIILVPELQGALPAPPNPLRYGRDPLLARQVLVEMLKIVDR